MPLKLQKRNKDFNTLANELHIYGSPKAALKEEFYFHCY